MENYKGIDFRKLRECLLLTAHTALEIVTYEGLTWQVERSTYIEHSLVNCRISHLNETQDLIPWDAIAVDLDRDKLPPCRRRYFVDSHPLTPSSPQVMIVRSTMEHVVKQERYTKGNRTYADPYKQY